MVSTDSVKICGCKGIRVCALCERSERATKLQVPQRNFATFKTYVYVCPSKKTALEIEPGDPNDPYSLETLFEIQASRNRSSGNDYQNGDDLGDSKFLACDDVTLINDFLTEDEETELVDKIDRQPWLLSQSGRRKQDYGPRVNFKQRKLKLDHFVGMPSYSSGLIEKMAHSSTGLMNYIPLELCNLEYDPTRRSCIDFHIDDTWIWGNRLISINLLAGSVMTLINESEKRLLYVPMARRSLLCMAGPMRYQWRHGLLPEHIQSRRIALTMREPANDFLPDGDLYEKWGQTLIERGQQLIEI